MGTKKNRTGKKISFDEELITKTDSANILNNTATIEYDENQILPSHVNTSTIKIKKKRKNIEGSDAPDETITTKEVEAEGDLMAGTGKKFRTLKNKRKLDTGTPKIEDFANIVEAEEAPNESEQKKKRKRKLKQTTPEAQEEIQEELNPMQPTINTTESLRKKKKKRHTELVDAKRVKTELNSQQKALNYLSNWKHCKDQWKFEKLTQVWIQNSLYDDTKLPDQIWTTVVEYFDSAKGKVRDDILNNAIKLYERESTIENKNVVILNRSKSIVQSLNE